MIIQHQTQNINKSGEIIIRQAKETDLPGLEWDGEYAHYRRLFSEIYQRTLRNYAVMWLAFDETGRILGQMFVQLSSHQSDLADGYFRAYMFGFRVKEEYRSLGIGTLLLLQTENDLINRKFQRVCLNVAKNNWRARRLYERHNYQVLHPDPGEWSYQDNDGYWHDIAEPAWRMEKHLPGRSDFNLTKIFKA